MHAIYVNVLRRERKYFPFEPFVADAQPDILLVTESQMTAKEARRLVLRGYVVVSKRSMPKDGTQMKGGVVVLTEMGMPCVELGGNGALQLDLPPYRSTILVYLNDDEQEELEITGV